MLLNYLDNHLGKKSLFPKSDYINALKKHFFLRSDFPGGCNINPELLKCHLIYMIFLFTLLK